MRLLLSSILAVTLASCGGGSSSPTPPLPPPPPEEGKILSSECVEYTLVEQIADGRGGSTRVETLRSPACGWNPPPYGELSESRCESPYTLVSVYHDGEYGFYEESEVNSESCGYVEPTLDVVVDNTYGDRFKPVVMDVRYFDTDGNRSDNWDFEAPEGIRVERVGNEIHVYGDGYEWNTSEYITVTTSSGLVADPEFVLRKEPRCEAVSEDGYTQVDCLGYRYRGRSDGMIYYGEDDTHIVEWDIAMVIYDNRATSIEKVTEGSRWDYAVETVEKYNKTYEANDIFIRFNLVGVAVGNYVGLSGATSYIRREFNADVGIGIGSVCPGTCGCAYPGTRFTEGDGRTMVGVSRCNHVVDLHEIGHAVGLAHGPDNSSNEANGYIFPEFGHGWSTPFCGRYIDIMSYGGSKEMHHNSKITCESYLAIRPNSYLDPESLDDPHGNREYADSAYHLNRVRYDVSLISRPGEEPAEDTYEEGNPEGFPLIEDHVWFYPNADQMIRQRYLDVHERTK